MLQSIILAIAALSFGLLTACDDGFKARLSSETPAPKIVQSAEEAQPGASTPEEDQVAVNALTQELRIVDYKSSQVLGNSEVKAFVVLRVDQLGNIGQLTSMKLRAVLMTGCAANETFGAEKVVDFEALSDGEVQVIGTSGPYEFSVYYNSVYDEMVASVQKKLSGSDYYARADYSLIGVQSGETNSTVTTEYISRTSEMNGLFQADTVAAYAQECSGDVGDIEDMFGGDYDAGDDEEEEELEYTEPGNR